MCKFNLILFSCPTNEGEIISGMIEIAVLEIEIAVKIISQCINFSDSFLGRDLFSRVHQEERRCEISIGTLAFSSPALACIIARIPRAI